ncbi:unnamed protein product [Pneumocystis jirovecii]|uniref:GOLD domain-containing protein n=2 Tax=Pneumocystis jirovecii TaxID=42068 RepID=L0PDF0_PNEJI|nr:uncharacterized protein T551_02296 [Pneumocystis jirovecii RU7]KTW29022.1 hypothetical protein T551_02296 [Pneumocystis jirovecii RU7]CCJ30129.1 unnamed protein product [Pneumocystis jirovecii]
MNFFQIKTALLISFLFSTSFQYSIILKDNTDECFFENLEKEDQIVISYQAGGDNGVDENLYVNFHILNPEDKTIVNIGHSNFHEYSLNANMNGKYKYCFRNDISGSDIELFFNVHHTKHRRGVKNVIDFNSEISFLGEILRDVRDEQEYIKAREKAHRNVAESTNSRVQNWNIFQIFVLIGLIFFQIYFLKRFFEVKRII